jgi:pyruvate dehydrogenase E2 component (dihydrolipoamide acetyltransferase)
MPQLGETVTEGTIIRWLKSVGDHVAQDEILFEVSTDKVDSEVPSPLSGVLTEILVPEGETAEVGARLAVISESGADALPGHGEAAAGAAASGAGPSEATASGDGAASGDRQAPAAVAAPPPPPPPAPPPRAATRPAPPPPPPPAPAPAGPAAGAGEQPAGEESSPAERSVLSPMVRRLLAEHSIAPSEVRGTGPGGRITRDDVLSEVDARSSPAAPAAPGQRPAPPPAAPAAAGPAGAVAATGRAPRDEVVPFTNIRRRTAEHMVRSKATSAHTFMAVEADFERVEQVRRAERERFREQEGVALNYLPFVSRAVVEALRAYPHLNASVADDSLVVHHDIHLGIAVDLDSEGLIVPVIHDADTKRLPALAREISDLASRARSRRLRADDIAGGTFTITNAGPMGTLITLPIINQPQVAILSTDGVRRRPVVVMDTSGGESIAIHSVGVLAIAFDHRAVDGAYVAGFLARLRETIEQRDWAQEL